MAISAAGIIFSSLNSNTLSRLTGDRTVAAIPFACRYRLIDFSLSNMVHANITNINIVANYNFRSLAEHIGSGKDWDLARRAGGINFVSPYGTAHSASAKLYSTHMEALMSMKEYIAEIREDTVVLMDSDTVFSIDLTDVIRQHEMTGANVTFVTKLVASDYSSKTSRLMLSSVAGKVTDMALSSTYNERDPELSLSVLVMKTAYLRKLIEEAAAYGINSLTSVLLHNYKYENYRTYCYDGYAASVSSFLDYYRRSMELVGNADARESLLGKKDAPILTKVHNSAPTLYKAGAHVENSMIADDCVIEGTVINSVLYRGVHIAKGAVVRNSVLFYGTRVEKNASLNCIVTDKFVTVTDGVELSGNPNMPFYVQKGRRV